MLQFTMNRNVVICNQQKYCNTQLTLINIILQLIIKSSQMNSQTNSRAPYKIIKMVGQGQFGKVYLAKSKYSPNKSYAVKIIPASKMKKHPKLKFLVQNEIDLLNYSLDHPNIIKLVETFNQPNQLWMVYEFCEGGTLEDKIPISQSQCYKIMSQIVKALKYAQSQNVLHRDLKPPNILFKKNKVKIADWGFSRILPPGQTAQSFIGSPAYMAPELLSGLQYGTKADVWSIGIMMYQCLYGQCPWEGSDVKLLNKQINQKQLRFNSNLYISPYTKRILERILIKNKQKRPCLTQVEVMLEGWNKQQIIINKLAYHKQQSIINKLTYHKQQSTINKLKYHKQQSIINKLTYSDGKTKQSESQINRCDALEFLLNTFHFLNKKCSDEIKYRLISIIEAQAMQLRQTNNPQSQNRQFTSPIKKIDWQSTKTSPPSKISPPSKTMLKNDDKEIGFLKYLNIIHQLKQYYSLKLKSYNNKIVNECDYGQNVKFVVIDVLQNLEYTINQINGTNKKTEKGVIRSALIQLNLRLDIIMYKQIPEQYIKSTSQFYICSLQKTSKSVLMKLLNHKMLLINQKYCKMR